MNNQKIKKEWTKLMGPLAAGHATRQMVSAFDRLTSQIYRARVISFDEFLAAQTVIQVANGAAKTQAEAGLEGAFLAA